MISNRLSVESLYVLYSFSTSPLNLLRMPKSGTCGMMFSLISSGYSGGAGRSQVKYMNVVSSIRSAHNTGW